MTIVRIQAHLALPKTLFRKYTALGVLVDENTKRHCYEKIKNQLPPHTLFTMPAGEKQKSLATCQGLWQQLTDASFDRHSLLMVVGGGVPGDLGGFCASTYKRGIDFVLIPTTLLSMADAGIGGKTGVDFGPLKNQLGTFTLPVATFISTDFLQTLPLAELRSGFAEVIKHCLISNRRMWDAICKRSLEKQDWLKLVQHSVRFKTSVVKKDPREKGLRKILNYGHTLGHALEGYGLSTGKELLHGEAVAAGMILEAHIAQGKKLLKSEEVAKITGYILDTFGKTEVPDPEKLLPALRQDKKGKGKEILMALPKSIGKSIWDVPVSEREIREAIEAYRAYQT